MLWPLHICICFLCITDNLGSQTVLLSLQDGLPSMPTRIPTDEKRTRAGNPKLSRRRALGPALQEQESIAPQLSPDHGSPLLLRGGVQGARDRAAERGIPLHLQTLLGTTCPTQQVFWERNNQQKQWHTVTGTPFWCPTAPRGTAPLPAGWVLAALCGTGTLGCCSVITLSRCC